MRAPLVSLLFLSSCNIVLAPPQVAESLRRNDMRLLAAEPDMTVLSPFGARMTAELIDDVREAREAIEGLLDVELPRELLVTFRSVEVDGVWVEQDAGTWRMTGVKRASSHGVVGYHTGSVTHPEVAFFVPSEGKATSRSGKEMTINYHFGMGPTFRHELAHACAKQAGLDGDTWFDEGLAEEIEHRTLDAAGRLVPASMNASLEIARDHHGEFTIDDVLDWREDGWGVSQGTEEAFRYGRPLSHALIRYLLGRTPGASLQEKFHRILALDREVIRAMGADWKAWLDALPK